MNKIYIEAIETASVQFISEIMNCQEAENRLKVLKNYINAHSAGVIKKQEFLRMLDFYKTECSSQLFKAIKEFVETL